jgi:hypothetical protein
MDEAKVKEKNKEEAEAESEMQDLLRVAEADRLGQRSASAEGLCMHCLEERKSLRVR